MHTFKIVGADNGWVIQLGAMTTPCKSQAAAIQQAQRMAAGLRRHGQAVSVVVEQCGTHDAAESLASAKAEGATSRMMVLKGRLQHAK